MRLLILTLLFLTCFDTLAQNEKFLLQGKVVNRTGQPIADTYVVNLNSREKSVTRPNGVFDMWVQPSDSLVFLHISYYRKIVTVFALMINPEVHLESEHVEIGEIQVSPDQQTDYQRAMQNVAFIQGYDVPSFTKIKPDPNPVHQMVIENNELMRSEASSVSIVRFSPGTVWGKWKKKREIRKQANSYGSTKKKKEIKDSK